MTVMRLTIIDAAGAVSLVSPPHGAKVFTAACSKDPATLPELLEYARSYDAELVSSLLDGLAVFDEHNATHNYAAVHAALESAPPEGAPPFRVVDEVTRAASVTPTGHGLVLFNLDAQRIVQVQNSYGALQRRDRGRVRAQGRPTRRLYRYELPSKWRLIP